MRTISQRELRNENADVMRRIEEGESFVVTRRGVPVARLIAFEPDAALRCIRPAKRRVRYSSCPRLRVDPGTPGSREILTDLRGGR